ncbi:hypothetical protein COCCADRAFT_23619 [Bipolaris zeicola 26-R-13]|uniref:Uncharacterized protein n=1 Tax=Cochliobolus carbonum (strain 26-R-13) TaxID=930089 RepID=W6YGE0_COCC2|nr:uncharacterized protein COCCADRAFT_23619 [Bipolaris zeicola 26-R-13]EUC36683.1 hypothetical protein COCCADRAFT_23619 [Bipolaris zeicola 26-R-13]
MSAPGPWVFLLLCLALVAHTAGMASTHGHWAHGPRPTATVPVPVPVPGQVHACNACVCPANMLATTQRSSDLRAWLWSTSRTVVPNPQPRPGIGPQGGGSKKLIKSLSLVRCCGDRA